MKDVNFDPNQEAYLKYATKEEAEEIVDCMKDIIKHYGFATVADLRDLVGEDDGGYELSKYGWTDIGDPEICTVHGEEEKPWRIVFPPVVNINDTDLIVIPSDVVTRETIMQIEDMLIDSKLIWQISYDPAKGSFHIDIR